MEVKDSIKFPKYPGYSIEWGNATWTEQDDEGEKAHSIRNRYSKEDGGFNVRGSSEIPWNDFLRMISESIKRKHFTKEEISVILVEISTYIKQS